MKVLALNCGSSTLKFRVFELPGDISHGKEKRMAHGVVERIGGPATMRFVAESGERLQSTEIITDHAEAACRVVIWLNSLGIRLDAVGHRVVHGGHRFVQPALIDNEVIESIESLRYLAPLHNEPSLMAIRAVGKILGPKIPMAAVFDTAFHSNMPERSSYYAIPKKLSDKHHIRRYGFHGIAHRYMAERYATITSMPVERLRLITLQLGNGCSASAVHGGSSVDTSMGFTPLEGLMMGTRSGDVDPHLPRFLAESEGVDVKEIEDLLNTKSGLLGVSGLSRDMRELLEAERRGDAMAALSVEMFCYRVRKQIGAYLSALGGAEAVIFGGGIGENSPEVRSRICAGMEWAGLILDEGRNKLKTEVENRISADISRLHVYVISVDEELIIAHDTASCLAGFNEKGGKNV
jgi:acetate kinase